MKKSVLFLSLFFLVNTQAADSDAYRAARMEEDRIAQMLAAMDEAGGAPAQDILEQEVHQVAPQDEGPIPVVVKTSDGKIVEIPDARKFSTLRNLIEDLGEVENLENPISLPEVDSHHLQHANWLYNDPNYYLPLTQEELQDEDITLEGLLETLNYLDAQDFLERFYIAWLNHPNNQQSVVHHHAPVSSLFEQQLGLDITALPRPIALGHVALHRNLVNKIHNYTARDYTARGHDHVSIQNLIDAGEVPQIGNNGDLNLSGKNITSLKGLRNIPGIEEVKNLALSGNYLKKITFKDFANLPALESLILSNNFLEEIAPGAFKNLTALENLSLDTNKLEKIVPNIFIGLSNVKRLALFNNEIKEIISGSFENLSALENLSLNGNKLEKIVPGIFKDLPALVDLHLDFNPLEKIDYHAFENLPALENLSIVNTRLKAIVFGTFVNMPRLATLNLADNSHLQAIAPNTFRDLPSLRTLYLHGGNQLSSSKKEKIKESLPQCDVTF